MAARRLPGKVMLPLAGAPMLQRLVERVKRARLNDVIVATTVHPPDAIIVDLCDRIGCSVFRGPIDDVTERLLGASAGSDVVVQITGDCPLIDPAHIDEVVRLLIDRDADYAGNNFSGLLPIGFDVRAFTTKALRRSAELSSDPVDRVHGSYFIHRHADLFRQVEWGASKDLTWPDLRLTVDEPSDYELVRRVFETLYPVNDAFDACDVVNLLRDKPDWVRINSGVRQKAAAEG